MRLSYRFLATALGVALIATVPALGFQSRAEAHAGPDGASVPFVSWQPRIEGQPYFFSAGSAPGIYFWHNEPDGLSLRTTDPPGVSHEYSGVITTDGTIINLQPYELESDDSYNLGPMGHVLTFDFHTDSVIDGLNFEIAGGTGVKLGAQMDGMPMPLSNIYLGEAGVNPVNNPLWVCREDNGACLANLP